MRRAELLKIFYALARNLTDEEYKWLKTNEHGWESFGHTKDGTPSTRLPNTDVEWIAANLSNVYGISYRIQEIVDAKISVRSGHKQKLKEVTTFGEGLPKIYLAEIALMLGLDIANKKKWELVNAILAELPEKA